MVVRDPERSIGALDSMSAADLRSYLSKSGEDKASDSKEWFLAKDGERQVRWTLRRSMVVAREFGATDRLASGYERLVADSRCARVGDVT